MTFKDTQGHYNYCRWIGCIWVTTSLSSTISEILSFWPWEILHLDNKSSAKSFGKSHVATPHGRNLTHPLRVLPGHIDKRWITCIANRLIYEKTNFIGDHGTWVKCDLVRKYGPHFTCWWSAHLHFTNGHITHYYWNTNPNFNRLNPIR